MARPGDFACRHATPQVLRQAVQAALLPTHVHPEGIEGAFVQAAAVAALCSSSDQCDLSLPPSLVQGCTFASVP